MSWYYLSDSHERIPLSDAQFGPLAASGVLRPATPVWRKGMADWATCGEVKPEIFTAAVTRESDHRHSGTDNAAVRGAVIGLGRTLARYGVWLRAFGIVLLISAVVISAGLGWQAWILFDTGAEALNKDYPFHAELDHRGLLTWAVWFMMAIQCMAALISGWLGWLLVRAAVRAREAVNSGDEHTLGTVLRDVGRYFMILVIWTLVLSITGLAMALWLGWDKAFPPPPSPSEQRVTI